MKTYLSKEVVNGVLKLVQYVTYSNGTRVKRVIGRDGIPETVEEIKGE
jgi:predicted DNA-binding antitoxin AbrB/MazE fold protein